MLQLVHLCQSLLLIDMLPSWWHQGKGKDAFDFAKFRRIEVLIGLKSSTPNIAFRAAALCAGS